MTIRTKAILTGVACLWAATAPASTLPDTYSGLFVFGDSLSDIGRLAADAPAAFPPSPPYAPGRFSNGPLWADLVGQEFTNAGRTLENYAYAGATAITGTDFIVDLSEQIDELETDITSGSVALGFRPLGVVFIGGNDIAAATGAAAAAGAASFGSASTPEEFAAALGAVVAAAQAGAQTAALQIRASVAELGALGIADIVLVNSTDIGATPEFQSLGFVPATVATAATAAFNAALAAEFTTLNRRQISEVSLFDFAGLTATITANPSAFGFDNVTDACVTNPLLCTDPDTFAFWDSFHPTAAAHARIAEGFRASVGVNTLYVAPIPLPAGVWSLLAGIAAFSAVGAARARRAAA